MPEFDSGLWTAGWIAGGVVVVLVAALALTLIRLAVSIRATAFEILGALERARDATAGLWALGDTNAVLSQAIEGVRGTSEEQQ